MWRASVARPRLRSATASRAVWRSMWLRHRPPSGPDRKRRDPKHAGRDDRQQAVDGLGTDIDRRFAGKDLAAKRCRQRSLYASHSIKHHPAPQRALYTHQDPSQFKDLPASFLDALCAAACLDGRACGQLTDPAAVRPPAKIRSAWQNRRTPRCRGVTMSASDTFRGRTPRRQSVCPRLARDRPRGCAQPIATDKLRLQFVRLCRFCARHPV